MLKEKPAGCTVKELVMQQRYAIAHNLRLTTAAQYRFGMHWTQIQAWLPFIGALHFVEGTRRINISDLGRGWRASKILACGGALDRLSRWFGWSL